MNSEKRDNLLSDTEGIEINSEHKITNTSLLFGSDINFTFNFQRFQWYRNDFVYLIDKEGYMIRNEKAQNDTDKYFCFNTQAIESRCDFIQKLNELIDNISNTTI